MADKNKIKGWNSYPHKLWRRLVSTDIGFFFLIEFAVVVMGAIAGVLIWWLQGFETLSDGLEFFRVLITTMIAFGGAYGLILATRRAAKFSEQVDTGQKQVDTGQNQLFNEQLGRAAELLANEKMAIRQAGIRVLADLAEKTPDQVKLIMQIIYDFVEADALSSAMPRERLDIALGIKMLGFLYNKSGQKVELKKLVEFTGYHLKELDLRDAELQGVEFWQAKLQGAKFFNAQLQGVKFFNAQLQGAQFFNAQLQRADFNSAQLQWADCMGANFSDAKNLTEEQVKGMIFKVNLPPTLPKGLEQFLDKKRGYEVKEDPDDKYNLRRCFVDSDAEWSGRVIHEWVREYLTSISGPEDA